MPDEFLSIYRFESMYEYVKSDVFKMQESAFCNVKSSIPGVFQRASDLMKSRIQGRVPNGWKYDQKPHPTDRYSIEGSRLYATVSPKKVSGTQITLPTRQIELYEFNRNSLETTQHELPKEVAETKVFLPESESIAIVADAGSVCRKATVNCHELGDNYLLYRAETSNLDSAHPYEQKRKLIIDAHGESMLREKLILPDGIKISFYAPAGEILLASANLSNSPLDATYSTHELEPLSDIQYGHRQSRVTTPEGTSTSDDYGMEGKIVDLSLTKFGSPVRDAKSAAARVGKLLNNSAEGSAWAAIDNNVDVLTVRQAGSPQVKRRPVFELMQRAYLGKVMIREEPTIRAKLSDVLEQLQKVGLDSQYDEIRVMACRGNGLDSAVHSIGSNVGPRIHRFEI